MNRRVRLLMWTAASVLVVAGCSSGASAGGGPTAPAGGSASPSRSESTSSDPATGLLVYQWQAPTGNDSVTFAAGDGSGARAVLPKGVEQGFHPDWSPDGTRVVFSDQDTGLWVMALDGSASKRVHNCSNCDFPAWSPDGGRILFTQYVLGGDGPPKASSLEVLDLGSSTLTQVVTESSPRLVDVARWSPDGKQIVYGIDRFDGNGDETGSAIAVVTAAGGKPRVLTDYEDYAYYPDWSPDGSTIVYSVETVQYAAEMPDWADTWDLWTVAPDGSDPERLTDVAEGIHVWQPTWAPDGTAIYATQDSATGREAVRVELDGSIGAGLTGATHVRLQPTG